MSRTKTMVAGLLAVASLSGCNVEPMEQEADVMPLAQSKAGAHRHLERLTKVMTGAFIRGEMLLKPDFC